MKVKIRYFASLREKAGKSQEEIQIDEGKCLQDIYLALSSQYSFPLSAKEIKFSLNNDYVDATRIPQENDVVVFIPPVAGG